MRSIDLNSANWRKSSYSNSDGGMCVEVADNHPTVIPVRDSKHPHHPALTFHHPTWNTFLSALQNDELGG